MADDQVGELAHYLAERVGNGHRGEASRVEADEGDNDRNVQQHKVQQVDAVVDMPHVQPRRHLGVSLPKVLTERLDSGVCGGPTAGEQEGAHVGVGGGARRRVG